MINECLECLVCNVTLIEQETQNTVIKQRTDEGFVEAGVGKVTNKFKAWTKYCEESDKIFCRYKLYY